MPQATSSPSDRLRPYVSRILIDWLRETPEARHCEVDGSLAFVDISGFTELTERLARKGKVGSEEISDTLDSCFGQLLSVAYDYDAGVVKWGGDAVQLLFTGPGHAERACRASVGMQQTMRRIGKLRTSAGPVQLKMSIGIHSGAFDFFLVGDLHRELVLTGPGASETVAMESAASAGEIAVSAATAASLDPGLLGPARGRGRLLERPPEARAQRAGSAPETSSLLLDQCFSHAIREHLLAEPGEPEHRMVTAAFVEFSGTDARLEQSGVDALADALEECMSDVQRACARHEVAFFETDVSPDGGKIMLVAGAPTSAGNDEERMLRTLRQVMDHPRTLPLRAGVNAGRVFADDFGPFYRRTYSVKGDAVNLAARLMAKAQHGQILAAPIVPERSRAMFELRPLEPFHVKGKKEPVAAVSVGTLTGSRTAAESETPLVGRDAELAVLLEALERAGRGEGRVVEIVGETGIGKTRLVGAMRAKADGVTVLETTCEEYESSTAYFPFRGLLRDLLGVGAADDEETAVERLRERVASTTAHLLPWLPLLAIPLDLEAPSTPETDRLDEKFRKAQLEEVTSGFLGEILSAPTLIVLEDMHLIDDASGDLVRRLARDVSERPWLIVTTRRPPAASLGTQSPGSVELELEPLTQDAAAALVRAVTDDLPIAPHQLQSLTLRAAGNPLFLTELAGATRTAGSAENLPDSVEALVTSQIDRLPPGDRTLLRYASVLGRSFEEELLAASLDETSEQPGEANWERLSGFLAREPQGIVRFRHALVRDTAYEGLPYRRRRQLHARAGETIERLAGTEPEHAAELLSLHFFHAGRFPEAWRYSRLAGDHARSIYANAEAADFYVRALDASRRVEGIAAGELADVSESLGDALERLGLFGDSAAAYRGARRHRAGDRPAEAALMLKEGWIADREGRFPQALRWFSRGLRLLEGVEGHDARAGRAQLMVGYATVRQMQGRSSEAIRWCRTAVEEAERAGDRKALAHAYYILDWAYLGLGRPEDAVHSPLALEIYEALGDLGNKALVQNNMGGFAYWEGRWEDAVRLYEEARAGFATIGDPVRGAAVTFNIAEIRCDQGRLEEAEELLRDALLIGRAAGFRETVALANRQLGTVAMRSGRLDDALRLLEAARAEFVQIGVRSEVTETDGRIGECLLLQGEGAKALALVSEALTRAGALHLPALARAAAYAHLQTGDPAASRAAFEASLRAARERRDDYQVALTLDALVRLAHVEKSGGIGELEAERDSILAGLKVVKLPPAPPVRATRPAVSRSS